MGLPLLLGVAGLAGAGAYAIGKGSSDEPREPAQKDETPTATATQGQGTDGQGGQYNFSELEMNAPQQTFKSTNVAYLDKKLADGTANFWDALAAKQFLGMNLGEYGHQSLDVNFNGKHKITNLNKLYGEANNVVANADLYKAVTMSGFDEGNDWIGNIGVVGEIARDLHEIAPFMPIGKENNQYRVLQRGMAFAAAIDESGGSKPNQYTQKRLMEQLDHSSRGDNEQASVMAAQLMRNSIVLNNKMQNILALGGQIPKSVIDAYKENQQLIEALNKRNKDGDFDRKDFVKNWKHRIDINNRMLNFGTNYSGSNADGSGQTQTQNTERVVERN
jgi:hypothetical protein